MYNSYYSPQANIERINNQIAELERIKSQLPQAMNQPTNLTQNFQLTPQVNNQLRYANSIEQVKKESINCETPFFSDDMSVLWLKSPHGNIKTFELTEIVPKDEKDVKIEMLIAQVEELKKGMRHEQRYEYNDEHVEDEESEDVQSISRTKKKSK